MLTNRWLTPTLIVGLLLGMIGLEHHQLVVMRGRAASLALRSSNAEAQRDTTRLVSATNARVNALMGDSLRLYERRVVQAQQQRDALDRALGVERAARYSMSLAVEPMRAESLAATSRQVEHDLTKITFDIRETPYTAQAEVMIPTTPDSARISLRVHLDSIHATLRIGCGAADANGVRSAWVDAAVPLWARLRFDTVTQVPELCALRNSAAQQSRVSLAPIVIGLGRLQPVGATGSWGLFIGAGLSLR